MCSNTEQIRLLDFSQWLEVLKKLFGTMLKLLRALQVGIIHCPTTPEKNVGT